MHQGSFRTLAVYLGAFFVGFLVLLLVISFVKKGIYSQTLGINLVVIGDSGVSLMLIRPTEEIMSWVRLPSKLSVRIINSTAVYPSESLWKFAVGEKETYSLVSESLSQTLGVVLPKVVKVVGESTPENLLGSIHKLNLQTNLTWRDRVILRKDLASSVTSRKYLEVDIPKSSLTKKLEPDGTEVLEVNSIINLWTKNRFVFDPLLGESSDIKIYNLSQTNGKALFFSRLLESSGARVVEVGSAYEEPIEGKGCLFESFGEYPETSYVLKNFLNCTERSNKNKKTGEGIKLWLF